MREGINMIQCGIVPGLSEAQLNHLMKYISDSIYVDGIEAGYKAGYEAGSNNGRDIGNMKAQEEYQRGLNDAWEAARKIEQDDAICDLFDISVDGIYADYTASEAIERIKAYEQKEADRKECSIIGMECPYDELCAECQVNLMVEQARAKAREGEKKG